MDNLTMNYRILWVGLVGLLSFYGSGAANAGTMTFGSGTNQFNMDFVTIDSPGNAADTTGSPNPAGAVGYTYQMGTYEVSRDMIIKATAAGSLGITLSDMSVFGGNGANRPTTGVSWNEAARFVNWLNTSSGGSAAYNFTTTGANANIALWTFSDTDDYDALNPFRSKRANYVLPTIDEWYKAAYFDPSANGGLGGYWNFTTGSDAAPTAVASGTTAGTAVYGQSLSLGPADITQAGGLSPFGVMGLGGNVWEWNETESDLVNNSTLSDRVVRGGGWLFDYDSFSSSSKLFPVHPSNGSNFDIGFRVASLSSPAVVPEPGSLAIWGMMSVVGWLSRGRRVRKLPSSLSSFYP